MSGVSTTVDVHTAERGSVPDTTEESVPALTTEQMLAVLAQPGSTERAYQVTEAYERVERVYNASLSIGTFSASAASTNPR